MFVILQSEGEEVKYFQKKHFIVLTLHNRYLAYYTIHTQNISVLGEDLDVLKVADL